MPLLSQEVAGAGGEEWSGRRGLLGRFDAEESLRAADHAVPVHGGAGVVFVGLDMVVAEHALIVFQLGV